MKSLFFLLCIFISFKSLSQSSPWKFESNKVVRLMDNSKDSLISVKERDIFFDADNLVINILPDSMKLNIVSKAEIKKIEEHDITMLKMECTDQHNNKCIVVLGSVGNKFNQLLVYYAELGVKYYYYIYNQIL